MGKISDCLRHPKTLAEKRANCGAEALVRAKRKAHNLPSLWDDKWRVCIRSWKRYRKHQHH